MGFLQRFTFANRASRAAALRFHTSLRDQRRRESQVTETATCGKCDGTIRLSDKHVTINRHIEFMDSPRSITVVEAETIEAYHLTCAP